MKTLLEQVEPALSFARAELLRIAEGESDSAAEWQEALAAVAAARAYLIVHRTPEYGYYEPSAALAFLAEGDAKRRHVLLSPASECVGDVEQVRVAVDTMVRNAVLELDAILGVELIEEEEIPQLRVSFDGPGRFPEAFSIGGFLEIPFDDLASRWTAITRGGRIDKAPYGLVLRLKGVRVVPESKLGLEVHTNALLDAETRLERLAEGAVSGKEGAGELRRAVAALESILGALEATERAGEPSNVCVLVQEVVKEHEARLKHAGIAVEVLCDAKMPPVHLRRDRMRSFFVNALGWAHTALPAGGSVSLLVDYDSRARQAGIVLALEGLRGPVRPGAALASMRRAVVEAHGGV
ncbi:MAG: hypothetical protein RBU21_14820, partial [FCB group bacterium]|nr:hypothetical protein [FCB group bacterium]